MFVISKSRINISGQCKSLQKGVAPTVSTRLGQDWEWSTRVSVVREGNFTRLDEAVDETEIFEGAENTLTMGQTYTWEFQCHYMLQKYPFDTQV